MAVMAERLSGLGANWDGVTAVNIYTAQPVDSFIHDEVVTQIGSAAHHGIHWYLSHPPIADLVYEMDLRGVRVEVRI